MTAFQPIPRFARESSAEKSDPGADPWDSYPMVGVVFGFGGRWGPWGGDGKRVPKPPHGRPYRGPEKGSGAPNRFFVE